jgi:hypothetical protein
LLGATYDNLKNFLNVIENNLSITDVKRINYLPEEKKVDIDMTIYVLKN